MVGWPALGGKNTPHGIGVTGIGTQTINGFGGKRHQATLSQQISGLGNRGFIGGDRSFGHVEFYLPG